MEMSICSATSLRFAIIVMAGRSLARVIARGLPPVLLGARAAASPSQSALCRATALLDQVAFDLPLGHSRAVLLYLPTRHHVTSSCVGEISVSKYEPLSQHFRTLGGQAWHATFEDLEKILGFPLPNSARAYPAWWANSADQMPQKSAWLDAGWRTRDLNLSAGHVLFVRRTGAVVSTPRAIRPPPTGTKGLYQPPANAPHNWETGRAMECRLRIVWVPLGRVVCDAAGRLAFPVAEALPAIYRFRIRRSDSEKRYIGQTENLARRFGHYRNPGPSQQTNIRLNAEFLKELDAGAEISVAAVTAGAWIDWGSGPVIADMSSIATRCLLENAAILDDGAVGVESLNRGHLQNTVLNATTQSHAIN